MTFTPNLPESYPEFLDLVETLDSDELGEMLRRIRAYNAHALSEGGRKKLQTLYGCIVQYFVSIANRVPIELKKLDTLSQHIVELTPLIPFYSAQLARARIEKENEKFRNLLKDPVGKADAWLPSRAILLFKLFTSVFPVTDKRHPVLTPMGTCIASNLALSPLIKASQVSRGLLLAQLYQSMHQKSNRFAVESLSFYQTILSTIARHISVQNDDEEDTWISVFKHKKQRGKPRDLHGLDLLRILSADVDDPYFCSQEYFDALLNTTLRSLESMCDSLKFDAFPEVFDPVIPHLEEIKAHAAEPNTCFHPTNMSKAGILLEKIRNKMQSIENTRKPLSSAVISRAPEAKQFNPRFEEGFVKGKDYDPDRERSERRRLQKQLRKEERGAIRELRKDAVFMAGVRDQEKARLQARLDNSAKRAISFLQQQESDFKSGGQGGMWKKKKKK